MIRKKESIETIVGLLRFEIRRGIISVKREGEENTSEHQLTMVSLDQLVSKNHQYRKFKELFNFGAVDRDFVSRI